MSEQYAYKIDNGLVIDGIVTYGVNSNAQWAMDNLGGFWVDSFTLAWIGGTWDEEHGFQPPYSEPEPEEEL